MRAAEPTLIRRVREFDWSTISLGPRIVIDLGAVDSMQMTQTPKAPSSTERVVGFRILLVEDHADTLRIMKRILEGLGYCVITAMTVGEARKMIHSEVFDVLVSDIGLPDGSGLEIMRELKSCRGGKGIALSGYKNDEDLRNSREAGFVEHLVKPVDLKLLDSTLQQVVKANHATPYMPLSMI